MKDIKKSIERLIWRFKDKKNFTPNDNDIKALNCVIEWVNNQKKETLNNNHLFAKLYIYHLTMNIRHFGTTIFDPIPQQDLSKILDYPLEYFYKSFYNDLHSNQLLRLLGSDSQEEKEKIIQEYKEDNKIASKEEIEASLNHMITEALNRFN